MSEPKFTPGPWNAKDHDLGIFIRCEKDYLISGPIIDRPDGRRNAHLIAAAPELYEALEKIVENNNTISVIQYDDRLQARAALAKARGEG